MAVREARILRGVLTMQTSSIVRALAVAGIAAAFAPLASSAAEPLPPQTQAARRPTLVLLSPGLRVPGPRPIPQGWTHLVIKSLPRLSTGELDTLPSVAQSTATLFRATVLADVRKTGNGGTTYELQRLGVGLCTPIRGVDTVVTSATANQLNAGLGFIGRKVLDEAEHELMRGRVKARTPTFVLYSAPSVRKTPTGHQEVLLRYALLVDPRTGSLQTIFWSQPVETAKRIAPEQLALLPPGLIFDAALDVAAARVLNAVPVNWSFALTALPSGVGVPPSTTVRDLTLRDTLAPHESTALEGELRRAVLLAARNSGGAESVAR